jgi:hypothetical protein
MWSLLLISGCDQIDPDWPSHELVVIIWLVSSVSVSVSHVSKLIRSKEVLLPRTVIFAPMIAGTFLPVCS